uniref:Uncharacterized protein n=1 Tax=Cereibacter sphaeroides (strain ATCC 17025 / ATH 2.4.3) TaxID=349102 RepID=A4WTB7_CERS5
MTGRSLLEAERHRALRAVAEAERHPKDHGELLEDDHARPGPAVSAGEGHARRCSVERLVLIFAGARPSLWADNLDRAFLVGNAAGQPPDQLVAVRRAP